MVAHELTNQVVQSPPCQCTVAERNAHNILSGDPGEVRDDFPGVGLTEDKPRIAFVGYAVVGFERQPVREKPLSGSTKVSQLVVRPTAPRHGYHGQGLRPLTHSIPPTDSKGFPSFIGKLSMSACFSTSCDKMLSLRFLRCYDKNERFAMVDMHRRLPRTHGKSW